LTPEDRGPGDGDAWFGTAVPCWEHFEHAADVGVRGRGRTPAEAFEQAALALTAVVADPDTVRGSETVEVDCSAPDLELLLADWLNRVIFEVSTRGMLFSRFAVHIDGVALRGSMSGEKIDPARHHPAVEPKGATFTALRVMEEADGSWLAQCVVDV